MEIRKSGYLPFIVIWIFGDKESNCCKDIMSLYYYIMKSVNALLWVVMPFCALLAQNQTVDSLSVSTNFLDEVVVTDSRFALKRSQSGKTIIKIKS